VLLGLEVRSDIRPESTTPHTDPTP
jgi:hypothetical protein